MRGARAEQARGPGRVGTPRVAHAIADGGRAPSLRGLASSQANTWTRIVVTATPVADPATTPGDASASTPASTPTVTPAIRPAKLATASRNLHRQRYRAGPGPSTTLIADHPFQVDRLAANTPARVLAASLVLQEKHPTGARVSSVRLVRLWLRPAIRRNFF